MGIISFFTARKRLNKILDDIVSIQYNIERAEENLPLENIQVGEELINLAMLSIANAITLREIKNVKSKSKGKSKK